MNGNAESSRRGLSAKEIAERYGISLSQLYKLMREDPDNFPAGIELGPKAIRYLVEEVDAYMERRPRALRSEPTELAAARAARAAGLPVAPAPFGGLA